MDNNDLNAELLKALTAVKAVWFLWRSARWSILDQLGLTRELIDEPFTQFDEANILGRRGLLSSDRQAASLLDSLPEASRQAVLSAASQLTMTYMAMFMGGTDERTA